MVSKNAVRVMVIDDSALVRQTMLAVLTERDGFLLETAGNGAIGEKKIPVFKPDVIILDLEMPVMDGMTLLKKMMKTNPIPVIICSSITPQGSQKAIEALEAGAVDVIQKPNVGTKEFLEESKIKLQDAIRGACSVKVSKRTMPELKVSPKYTADVILSRGTSFSGTQTDKVVVVGASTGGTEALRVFLEVLPADIPPILIVQHMPKHFTKAFANRLNGLCKPYISEAVDGTKVEKGCVYIAPGDEHLLLKRQGRDYVIQVTTGPLVSRHRPSVDVLFRSAARYGGKNMVGIIMTGMGDDGAQGMLEMKQAGAFNIAQDEKTSVVFGMPREAIKREAADIILPLEKIAAKMMEKVG
ncbi:MAG: chemotaxis response regulator protein-glutamate methylesterase [Spirochaetales bacterium]|nr:chemotaxis response regulator protein-glutamate methylesterase [Spirochaetales bacterium]